MKRLIPVLTFRNRGLVKTTRFKNPQYIGDPINAVRIFNDKEVDELIVVDIAATRFGSEPDLSLVSEIAGEAFMPVCYGGGIKTLQQIEQILRIGVEKILINFSAFGSGGLVASAAKEFGSSTIVGGIDFKYTWFKQTKVAIKSGTVRTKISPKDYAKRLEELGCGELFINSIDRDGTYSGYDYQLLGDIASSVKIPVIGCGGAGGLEHVRELFMQTNVSAAAAGSMFVYYGPSRGVLINYPRLEVI